MRRGRYPDTVEVRSVLCYWAERVLGISTLELSKRLGISQPTASQSVKRGEKIVKEKGLKLMYELCQYINTLISVPNFPHKPSAHLKKIET